MQSDTMWLFFLTLMVFSGGILILCGNYERRIKALETNPITRIKIVPRSAYDDQSGVQWTSTSNYQYEKV